VAVNGRDNQPTSINPQTAGDAAQKAQLKKKYKSPAGLFGHQCYRAVQYIKNGQPMRRAYLCRQLAEGIKARGASQRRAEELCARFARKVTSLKENPFSDEEAMAIVSQVYAGTKPPAPPRTVVRTVPSTAPALTTMPRIRAFCRRCNTPMFVSDENSVATALCNKCKADPTKKRVGRRSS